MGGLVDQSVNLDNVVAVQQCIRRVDEEINFQPPTQETIDKVIKLLRAELTFTSDFLDSDKSASGGFSGASGKVTSKTSNVIYDFSASAFVTQEYKDGEKISESVRDLSPHIRAPNNVPGMLTTVVLRYSVGFRLLVEIDALSADASVNIATFSAQATAREINAKSNCVIFGYVDGSQFGMDLPGFVFMNANSFTAESLGAMKTWAITFQKAHNEYFLTSGTSFLPKITHVSVSTNKSQELQIKEKALLDAFVWRRFTFSDTLARTEEVRAKGKKDEVKENYAILTHDAVKKRYIQIMNEFGVEDVKSTTPVPKKLKEYADGLFRWFNHNQL